MAGEKFKSSPRSFHNVGSFWRAIICIEKGVIGVPRILRTESSNAMKLFWIKIALISTNKCEFVIYKKLMDISITSHRSGAIYCTYIDFILLLFKFIYFIILLKFLCLAEMARDYVYIYKLNIKYHLKIILYHRRIKSTAVCLSRVMFTIANKHVKFKHKIICR